MKTVLVLVLMRMNSWAMTAVYMPSVAQGQCIGVPIVSSYFLRSWMILHSSQPSLPCRQDGSIIDCIGQPQLRR